MKSRKRWVVEGNVREHKLDLELEPGTSPPVDTGERCVASGRGSANGGGRRIREYCTIASREMFDSRLEYLDAGELQI